MYGDLQSKFGSTLSNRPLFCLPSFLKKLIFGVSLAGLTPWRGDLFFFVQKMFIGLTFLFEEISGQSKTAKNRKK